MAQSSHHIRKVMQTVSRNDVKWNIFLLKSVSQAIVVHCRLYKLNLINHFLAKAPNKQNSLEEEIS